MDIKIFIVFTMILSKDVSNVKVLHFFRIIEMKGLSFFSYIIAGFFFLAAFGAFGNQNYESVFIYGVIGLAFILIKKFKKKH
ncbi:hypothetical protein [Aquimarina sp. MAR_2010_214]|uniref:hypothetical protein n=1 Tax=Aquimarina sp. MAR_2010_214 TaxID=1250026 RepID=UPI001304234D|nr:hypothetical protein [Aquimarina sp. MAR_2010_214]